MSHRFPLQAFLLVLLLVAAINAQKTVDKIVPSPATSPAPTAPAKPRVMSAATRAKIDQRKALGLTLLVSLANDARNFSNQTLRARTLSRIADALWEPDPDQGRALFRKAWDAAEVADQESARQTEEERQRQQAGDSSRPFALIQPSDLRSEVLRLAAKHDRALGEELLDKLKEIRKQEATDATAPARPDPLDTPAAVRQRLRLANQLLDADVERALQFADPVLGSVTMDSLDFLSSLRDKDAAAADRRYARLLSIAETDLKADANTVSLLSSYLFTPHLFVTFAPGGGQSSSSMNKQTPPPEVAPELRGTYLRLAAQVLLRPMPNREQDQSSSGLDGKYLVIKRLLPLFEQYASKEITEQLRVEMAVLKQGIQGDPSEADDDNSIQRGITPDRKSEDLEKSLLDRIDRAKTSAERDALYLQLANRTAQRGDMRARDFTDKIEDSDLRKQVKSYVDMSLARDAVEKKDTEKALILAAKGDLTHLQRAWVLTQVAKALPPAEREKALGTILDAADEARRIDVSDPDRPRALLAVANALWAMDHARAWETMLEVVKASNSAEGFNGEDGRITMRLITKNMTSIHSSGVEDFNLPGVFRSLSQENANQAIELARSFEAEAPRATALIAVARTLLSDKK
jgi:hypothetical protein